LNTEVNKFPTPYPDVNQILLDLLDNARAILGDYFTGMYLYGSLAGGDFDPGRSDIDFLVVTSKELPLIKVSDLEAMHKSIFENGLKWAQHLEGSYIPVDTVRKYSPTGPAWPMVNKKKFLVAHEDASWVINNYILYTSGVVIDGPPLKSVIDAVQPEELKEAVLTVLHAWAPWQNNASLFHSDEYQSFVVLTMCRALYTLKHGTVVSKPRSAEWAIANLDKKWTGLIKQAATWRNGDPPGDIGQTQEFMRYILKEAGL
jgi:predicted nucleotidyltransferase